MSLNLNESFTAVPGFRASGIYCGLRKTTAPDLALIVSDRPCAAAALFTRNLVQAAPVLYDRALLDHDRQHVRAVVINAGIANACTGKQGLRDAEATADLTRQALDLPDDDSVFVMSTGVIGKMLDMTKIAAGVAEAGRQLQTTGWPAVARAIMTTDTHPKMASVRYVPPGSDTTVTVAGVAKGAGMIHPDMATMLAVIATDAAVAPRAEPAEAPDLLHEALRRANQVSFSCITVDGDTSTNDTVLLLANGASGLPEIREQTGPAYTAFCEAVTLVCQSLARQIAWDGEGATKHITIRVSGAPDFDAARQVGRTVASSPLVKTALYGHDANWGRILGAAGRAGVAFDPERLSLTIGQPNQSPLELVRDGQPYHVDEERASQIVSRDEIVLHLDLGAGSAEATIWTCDLSHEYVSINAEYRT